MKQNIKPLLSLLSLLSLLVLTNISTLANANVWVGDQFGGFYYPCDNNYGSQSCWKNFDVAGEYNDAFFAEKGSGWVNFNTSFTSKSTNVSSDYVWLLNGNQYKVESLTVGYGSLAYGAESGANSSLIVYASPLGRLDVKNELTIEKNSSLISRGGLITTGTLNLSDSYLESVVGTVGAASDLNGSVSALDSVTLSDSSTWKTDTLNVTGNGVLNMRPYGSAYFDTGSLTIASGGKFSASNGMAIVGGTGLTEGVAVAGDATVTGQSSFGVGSLWETYNLTVTNGRKLTVADNGFVDNDESLLITNAGHVDTTTGRIDTKKLSITNGGTLQSTDGYIGEITSTEKGSFNAFKRVKVSGLGTTWDTGSLTVSGNWFNRLNVSNSGFVDVGGLLHLSGGDLTNRSYVNRDGNFVDGGRVESGNILIDGGSSLLSANGFIGASSTNNGSVSSLGDVLITGEQSQWNTGALAILGGKTLTVQDNALVNVSTALTLENSSRLLLLGTGKITTGSLGVSNGSEVFSNGGLIGDISTNPGFNTVGSILSSGSSIVSGGTWNISDNLTVTDGLSLKVSNQGLVNVGTELLIDGAGTVDTTGGGRVKAGSLIIRGSGQLNSTSGFVGASSTAVGSASSQGNATVTGNAQWNTGSLTVAGFRTLEVVDGGVVDVANNLTLNAGKLHNNGGRVDARDLIINANSDLFSKHGYVGTSSNTSGSVNISNTVTVSGWGSNWFTDDLTVTGYGRKVSVGNAGHVAVDGLLTINNYGSVINSGGTLRAQSLNINSDSSLISGNASVGQFFINSTNIRNDAKVSGSGARWLSGSLSVNKGRQLSVVDNGVVEVTTNLEVNSGGRVLLDGGVLTASNANITNGNLTINNKGGLTTENMSVGQSGSVHLNSGFIKISDDLINNGLIDIADGQLLTLMGNVSGSGSFIGETFLNGANVNPGNSPGTLTFGDTTWSDVLLTMEFAGFGSDQYDVININGDFNLLNSFAIDFDFADGLDFDSILGQSFNVLNVNGSFTGLDFASWDINFIDGWAADWVNDNNMWNLALNYQGSDKPPTDQDPSTEVPEPSTLLLMLLAFYFLMFSRKESTW